MRIFIAGKHSGADFCKLRETLDALGIQNEKIRFGPAFGFCLPDMPETEKNALRSLVEEKVGKKVGIFD